MRTGLVSIAATLIVLLAAFPVLAHHPFAKEFDSNKPVMLEGTVTKVTWKNPHAAIYINAKDANGNMGKWFVELASTNELMSAGWKPNSVKVGDRITVEGWASKDGSKRANAKTITMADGSKLDAKSSFFNTQQKPISN